MIKKSLVAIAVCSSILTFSCSESPNSPGKVTSVDVTADLQKLANTVDNLGMLEKSTNPERSLEKATVIEESSCNSLGTGIEVCNYSYGDETSLDTTYTYAMDGVTLKDWDDLNGSYKQKVRSHYTTPKYKGVMLFTLTIESPEVPTENFFDNFKMTMDGTATIDYYKDALILSFSKIAYTMENNRASYDYRFTMYDGKYSVKLNGNITNDSINEPADTAIVASGPITLVSTGETAGTLNLLYSGDVQILDTDGKLVKKTN